MTSAGDGLGDHQTPGTGSLAEEALRLVEALGLLAGAHAAGQAHRPSSPPPDAGPPEAEPPEAGPAECSVCPVCRLIAGVRGLRPEVLAHLVAAGEELLAAAREFATPAAAPAGTMPPGSSRAGSPRAGSPPRGDDAPRPSARTPEPIDLD
jgi:hypothetical protein